MSASELISHFGQNATVTRFGPGAFVNGTYVPGPTTTFDLTMSVQPLSGKELLNLPEAQRTRRQVRGYSSIELFTAKQSPSERADLVTVDGAQFEVQEVETWFDTRDLDHWKVRMAEVNP